jgi:HEAT repeat protein
MGTRFRAVRLLGEIGDPEAMVHLKNLLSKKGERVKVKEAVQESLSKLNQKAAA